MVDPDIARPHAVDRALDHVAHTVGQLHARRSITLGVIWLRILIGFAFLPAGLKKLLGQPFTDPTNHGRFHDFLHAFHDTGAFYRGVGAVQLAASILLMTQRFAAVGAFFTLPLLTAIGAFCWSTAGIPTTTVVTLMWLGTVGLLVWDLPRWRDLLRPSGVPLGAAAPGAASAPTAASPPVEWRMWERCGLAILAAYLVLPAGRAPRDPAGHGPPRAPAPRPHLTSRRRPARAAVAAPNADEVQFPNGSNGTLAQRFPDVHQAGGV
jgi:uncharacterized membrane protein YphA (DoxX/SURF4 family)